MKATSCKYGCFGIRMQCTMLHDVRGWCRTAKEGEMQWMVKLVIEKCLGVECFFHIC